MDIEVWKFWISVISMLGTFSVVIYLFITERSRVNTSRIDGLEGSIKAVFDDHGKRLIRLEERGDHTPSHDDLKRIYDRIEKQSVEINTLAGKFEEANNTLRLMHDYLLNKGK